MATETKSTISIAIISAISAVVIAAITTYGTIRVANPKIVEANKKLDETSGRQQKVEEEISNLQLRAEEIKEQTEDISFQLIANLPVGTIVASMLKPTKFAEAVGDVSRDTRQWVLADGRSIDAASGYGQRADTTVLPDLRGVFLRGMNVNGGKDPDTTRVAGDEQDDMLEAHQHTRNAVWADPNSPKDRWVKNGEYFAYNFVNTPPTDSYGGVETRPINVAVYFYIKIN